MSRVHVLEFEDLPSFPRWLRSDLTNVIVAFSRVMGVQKVLAQTLAQVLSESGHDTIVDLGSGSGGVLPEVRSLLRSEHGVDAKVILTDRFPNPDAIARISAQSDPGLSYRSEPLDAQELADAPAGVKTLVNAFHHLRPQQARAVLAEAQRRREPLLIYELTERKMGFLPWLIFLPLGLSLVFLMCLAFTPMVRPLTLRQLALTYVVPVIPWFYAWDGQASYPRIYSDAEMDTLLSEIGEQDGYRWEKGPCTGGGEKAVGYYVLGMPVERSS